VANRCRSGGNSADLIRDMLHRHPQSRRAFEGRPEGLCRTIKARYLGHYALSFLSTTIRDLTQSEAHSFCKPY
jgi:hypothetical protein